MLKRVVSSPLIQTRNVRKKRTPQPQWLEDATTFKDTHTVLTDAHSTLPYPTDQLRDYLHKTEVDKRLKQRQVHSRPIRRELSFDHIPIEKQCIVMFPGQGAQFVGMAKDLIAVPKAKQLFDHASEVLKYDLAKICIEGPKSKLDQTIYCQPAIFVSSLAALEKFRRDAPHLEENITETAGFSVGEFASLVLAGVLSFEDALNVVKARAEAMHECNQKVASGMITVSGSASSQIDKAIKEARQYAESSGNLAICEVSNYLYCGMKVIGASKLCIKFLKENQERFKFKVVKDLEVSGAFHTVLMSPAQQVIYDALKKVPIGSARMNVYSNYTGKVYPHKPAKIRENIVKQVSAPVKWEQIMQLLYRKHQDYKFPEFFEIGPGKQLGAILFKISKQAHRHYNHVSC